MLELPEVLTAANQLNNTIGGKRITDVTAVHTPHKFAWYHGDPQGYYDLLIGKTIGNANGFGSMVEIKADNAVILFSEGVGIRYHGQDENRPQKHQLLIEFDDSSAISGSIQMYGGLLCFNDGEYDNPYYKIAKEKPSPLSDKFDSEYFDSIISMPELQKVSVKALLATEQRIPGLGNGVLQDILFNVGIHPKRKANTLTDKDRENLFSAIKSTIAEIAFQGGRDTERDIFGCFGGYKTKLSKNTVDQPCTICGTIIKKENYMGGSIYYCSSCQALN